MVSGEKLTCRNCGARVKRYDNVSRIVRTKGRKTCLLYTSGIAPACRALIAPIEMATGTQAYFCGKPNPLMIRTGLNMLGCHSAEAVMVGDRMDTDVISGMESGMSTVLVLSGCSTKDTLRTYAYRPTMVLNGVGDIAMLAKSK